MRDALGGAVNVFIIVVFIVFAFGYMAYNVNYTKAFRMKDKIISIYEKYTGNCNSNCQAEIKEYADSIGYRTDSLGCSNSDPNKLYCVTPVRANKTDANAIDDVNTRCYYHIVTRINISLPIIQNLMSMEGNNPNSNGKKGLSVFYVTGDTKTMELPSNRTNC